MCALPHHRYLLKLAGHKSACMYQLITLAVTEELAVLEARKHIRRLTARASRQALGRALAGSPDAEPALEDPLYAISHPTSKTRLRYRRE